MQKKFSRTEFLTSSLLFFIVVIIIVISNVSKLSNTATANNAESTDNLVITKTADKEKVESDSTDNLINYTLEIKNNRKCAVPVDTVIVFDRSNSMSYDAKNPPEPITSAKEAANSFIKFLDPTKDQVAVVSYSNQANIDFDLSNDFETATKIINSLKAEGKTNIGDAIKNASKTLTTANRARNVDKVIVLFSDGNANLPNEKNGPIYAIQQADIAKKKGIKIISIGLGKDVSTDTMIKIASPDQYYFAPDTKQLKLIYEDIAKSLQGFSPNTIVSDDLTEILETAEFVSASNGGILDNNRIIWDLGEIECGGSRTVSFAVRLKNNFSEKTQLINTSHIENSSGDKADSNQVTVDILSPNLLISTTDNIDIAVTGDLVTYEITVQNNGNGWAYDVLLKHYIHEFLDQIDKSISDNGIVSGYNKTSWTFDIGPGETKIFYISAKVRNDIPTGYSDIFDKAILVNNDIEKQAADNTRLFKEPPKPVNFSIFVNCISLNNDNTFTSFFGYENSDGIDINLDLSYILPSAANTNVVKILKPGKYEKAFSVSADLNSTIIWTASAGIINKTATATATFAQCQDNSDQLDTEDTTIIHNPTPFDEFVGTPIVVNKPSENSNNQPPSIHIGKVETANICPAQITIQECNILDSDGVISAAQYSLDNGNSWYPITEIKGLGTKSAKCQITTSSLPDSVYTIKVRALDNNQNIGYSESVNATIDCDGIIIGPAHYSIGPIEAFMLNDGTVIAIRSTYTDMSLKVLGGPEKVWITKGKEQYNLTYNRELDLWQGRIENPNIGNFRITAFAMESSGETISREINKIQVFDKGKVLSDENSTDSIKITLYYREASDKNWKIWDGSSYDQTNPIISLNNSEYSYLVEHGEYYLEVEKPGFQKFISSIIQVQGWAILNKDIILTPNRGIFDIFNSLFASNEYTPVIISESDFDKEYTDYPIETIMPDLTITTDKVTISNKDLLKHHKPIVISFWTTWSTQSDEQFKIIEDVKQNYPELKNFEFYQVGITEPLSQLNSQFKRGQYSFDTWRITNLSYIITWNLISTPQHYFIDSNGYIREVSVGKVLTYDEIVNKLKNLEHISNIEE